MRLEQENRPPIAAPCWQDVEGALKAIHPKDRSFFILSRGSDYVQTAGARLRLTIEHRVTRFFGFSHFRLGREPISDEEISLNYSGGPIAVRRTEILSLDDCLVAFRCFFETGSMPDGYARRDITADFK